MYTAEIHLATFALCAPSNLIAVHSSNESKQPGGQIVRSFGIGIVSKYNSFDEIWDWNKNRRLFLTPARFFYIHSFCYLIIDSLSTEMKIENG